MSSLFTSPTSDPNAFEPFAEQQDGPKIVIADSKAAAEVFFHNSQMKLAHSLAGLRQQFVTTIRKLADQARLERFESLKKEIKSLDEAAQPALQEEILIDLDANSFSVQSLAFRKIKKGIKTSNKKWVLTVKCYPSSFQSSLADMDRKRFGVAWRHFLPILLSS